MRDILFRGKREDNGEWIEGIPFPDDNWGITICRYNQMDGNIEGNEVDPSSVGRSTALADANGTKIFEGDIVLKRTYNGKKAFAVTFDDGMFHCGYGGGSSTATHGYTLADKQIEVIGNVFDNPELLKGGDKAE